jgi:hypothetical protein
MNIKILWQKPILLAANKRLQIDEYSIPDAVDDRAGVYFFSRKYGSKFEPFYIGETTQLRSRLRTHLKDYRVRDVLRGGQEREIDSEFRKIAQGNKYFHFGYFVSKRRQDAKKCLEIVQAHMIELAINDEIPLLNMKLTKIPTHLIEFAGARSGRGFYGKRFQVPMK